MSGNGAITSARQVRAQVAQACLIRCSRCRSCRFVCFSVYHGDCSFYAACELQRLKTDVPYFYSGAALRHEGPKLEQQAAAPSGERRFTIEQLEEEARPRVFEALLPGVGP